MLADTTVLPRLTFTYEEWMRTTSRTVHPRSAVLQALDIWVDTYLRTPSPNNLQFLRNGLDKWKQTHGGESQWRENKRNTEYQSFVRLDAEINGKGDSDAALGTPDFMAPGMINARLGVIYLFGNLSNDDGYFKIATSGVLDLTTTSLDFASEQTEGGVQSQIKTAKTVIEQAKEPVLSAAGRIDQAQARRMKLKAEQQRTVTSRQLFESRTNVADPGTRQMSRQVSDRLYSSGEEISRTLQSQEQRAAGDKGESESMLGQAIDKAWEIAPGKLRALCDFLADKYLEQAAPFIGGGLATLSGLINAVEAGVTRWKEHSLSRDVVLLPGYPSTVAQSIRQAMNVNIAAGVYQSLKGGAQLAVQGVTAGAAAPVSTLVFSLVEVLVGTIWKLHDLNRMKTFFAQANEYWLLRNQPHALQTRPIAFNAWYKKRALHTPVISALALNSGICGDKMHFLKVYTNNQQAIPQSAFNAGVTYVDQLKEWCSKYMEDVGYKFSSGDPLVKELIKPGYRPPEGFVKERIWTAFKGFVSGG